MRHIKNLTLLFLLGLFALQVNAQQTFFTSNTSTQKVPGSGAWQVETRAGKTVELSHTDVNASMWSDQGYTFEDNWRIGVAIVFPKDMVAQYAGSKVVSLKFGWNTNTITPRAECFVRTELNGENKATANKAKMQGGTAGTWQGKWNQVNLPDGGYTLQAGDDLIIGYFTDVKPVAAGETTIATCTYGGLTPGMNYIMNCSVPDEDGGNQWIDLYSPQSPYPIFASAVIEDSDGNLVDICEIVDFYNMPVGKKDRATSGYLRIANRGTNNINSITLDYTFNGTKKSEVISLSSAVSPSKSVTLRTPFYALGSGKHTVSVAKVNNKANKLAKDIDYSMIAVPENVASQFKMTPLIEFFGGENSHYHVRNYEEVFVPSLAKHGKEMVIVTQHMNDQFMCYDQKANNKYDDATTILIDFAEGIMENVYAPVVAANRTAFNDPSMGIPTNPAVYVYTEMFADSQMFEPALNTPTFAAVDASYKLLAEDGSSDYNKMKITVSGEIAKNVLPQGEQLYLTVYVMEDNVISNSQEFPDDEELIALYPDGLYPQRHVIRLSLTPVYGLAVGDGGEFVKNFVVDLDKEWKLKDMSIVAFVNRSGDNDHFNGNVINATETFIDVNVEEMGEVDDKGPVEEWNEPISDDNDESLADKNLCYGYAPRTPSGEEISAHGTGKNNFIEAGICLNPDADPVVKRLKGSKLLGVRCFVRSDYKQKAKRWSGAWVREGNLDAAPTNKYKDLTEGWNVVIFDSPVTIGDQPIYVGYKLLEKKGVPYPVVSYSGASVNDGFYVNMDMQDFSKVENRGTLLVEAIIEPSTADFSAGAFVQASGWPKAVAPGSAFDCNLYVRSQTKEDIKSIEVTTITDNGKNEQKFNVDFETPIPSFDATLIPFSLIAPNTEGENIEMQLAVTAINGKECAAGKVNSIVLYVSEDAFERIPLIEEFTGLSCVNCPFMVYYLDKALEKYGPDHVYVSHHAGFQDDKLTFNEDKALLYLFGASGTFNPAVMYDRRMIPSCDRGVPVISAKEASSEPYMVAINEAMAFPAKASVNVEVTEENGKITCRVQGKIAKAMIDAADALHLTAYLVEDDIKPEGNYRQNGVSSNVAEDAPKDMVESFRHNGLIRIAFTGNLGDKIQLDKDGYFDVTFTKGYIRPMNTALDTYQDAKLSTEWAKANLRAVAFVHKVNTDLTCIEDNWVLNAGQKKLTSDNDAIETVVSEKTSAQIYNLNGQRVNNPGRGLYIINGSKAVIK